jgi:predicted transcriptional regulator
MKNRQKDEILRDILTVCNGGSCITRVIFHAYITHSQAKIYLQELITAGLVEYSPLNRIYRATVKGIEYLSAVKMMSELLPVTTRRTVKELADTY